MEKERCVNVIRKFKGSQTASATTASSSGLRDFGHLSSCLGGIVLHAYLVRSPYPRLGYVMITFTNPRGRTTKNVGPGRCPFAMWMWTVVV